MTGNIDADAARIMAALIIEAGHGIVAMSPFIIAGLIGAGVAFLAWAWLKMPLI